MRVLVVDDSRMARRIIRAELVEAGYEVVEAENGREALRRLEVGPAPDLITLDIEMPELNGFETLRRLRARQLASRYTDEAIARIPVILVTASDTLEVRKQGFALVAADFIAKPFEPGEVLAAVDEILRPPRRLQGLTALVAEDDDVARRVVVSCLEREGLHVLQASDGGRAFELLCNRMAGIDLVVTDLLMPGLDGSTLCHRIRKVLGLRDIPVLVLTAIADQDAVLKAFRAGATDYVVKPFVKEELLARIGVHLARTRMAQRLRSSISDLRELNQTKDEILSVCSHDMRSPLNGILGFADVLLDKEYLEADDRAGLVQIRRSGAHLLGLVNDILDLGRLEARGEELALHPLSLSEVAEASANALRFLAKDKDQVLSVEGLDEDRVPGNRDALVRAVNNLLSNAIKFTPEGGSIEVAVEAAPGGRRQVRVTDTGVGIPADKLPGLFDRFTRASSAGTQGEESTGLGMAIVRQISEAHGGAIEVRSREGRGTTMRLVLPAWVAGVEPGAPEPARPAEPARKTAPEEATSEGAVRRILLADDDRASRMLAARVLGRVGHEVTTASDGQEAVEAAEAGDYDLVFLDLSMPRLDGLEAAKRIRESAGADLPIIALTGSVPDECRPECVEAGMLDVLRKPFEPGALAAAIERWCR